jgi:Na+/proline symporter
VLSVSADGHQMALVHPKGRVLQYGSRIEIQCQDDISTKNAKMYPKGIVFMLYLFCIYFAISIILHLYFQKEPLVCLLLKPHSLHTNIYLVDQMIQPWEILIITSLVILAGS